MAASRGVVAPAVRGWAVRLLGERLRAGAAGSSNTAADLAAVLDGCDADLAVRHCAALLRHAGGGTPKVLLRLAADIRSVGVVPLLVRLALIHTMIVISTGGEAALELLAVLVPSEAVMDSSGPDADAVAALLHRLRTLTPLPPWIADDSPARGALVSLVATLPALEALHGEDRPEVQSLSSSVADPAVDGPLPPGLAAGIFGRAAHQPTADAEPLLDARPTRPGTSSSRFGDSITASFTCSLGEVVSAVCAPRHCVLCAARALLEPAVARQCPPAAVAAACARAMHPAYARAGGIGAFGSHACSHAAIHAAASPAAAEAALELLASYAVLRAEVMMMSEGLECEALSEGRLESRVESLLVSLAPLLAAPTHLPFRLPVCTCTPAPSHLARKQWEHPVSAALDVALRAASRRGDALHRRLVGALCEAARNGSPSSAQLLALYVGGLLRRHLRPAPATARPTPAPAFPVAAAAAAVSASAASMLVAAAEEHTVTVAALCASLPRRERVRLLGGLLLPLHSGACGACGGGACGGGAGSMTRGGSGSCGGGWALAALENPLRRLRPLLGEGEEGEVLDTTLEGEHELTDTQCPPRAAGRLAAVLDVAAWLHLRARGGFVYVDWLMAWLLRPSRRPRHDGRAACRSAGDGYGAHHGACALLGTLESRVRSGWEVPTIIRLQCVAAARAAAREPLPLPATCTWTGTPAQPSLSASCASLLRAAVKSGVNIPSELERIVSIDARPPSAVPSTWLPGCALALETALSPSSSPPPLPVALADASDDSSGAVSGVSLLLALQRRGLSELREALERLLAAPDGEAIWLDFVGQRLLPQLCTALAEPPRRAPVFAAPSGCPLDLSDALASRQRCQRRQLALLLSRLVRWSLPGREALRETLEPLPESVRAGAQHGAGRGRRAETALELEATVRAYLLGAQHGAYDEGVSSGFGGCVSCSAAAGTAAAGTAAGHMLEVTWLLPNVGLLATALMRRACTDETDETRSAAAGIVLEYVEWWPLPALQHEARRLVNAAGRRGGARHGASDWDAAMAALDDADDTATVAAVRALELLLALPWAPERCAPLAPTPVEWGVVFDEALCERIHLIPPMQPVAPPPTAAGGEDTPEVPPLPYAVIECVLAALPALECEHLTRRLRWLLSRPAVHEPAARRRERWAQRAALVIAPATAPATAPITAPATAPSSMASVPSTGNASGGSETSLAVWVRWELRAADADIAMPELENHVRTYLATQALPARAYALPARAHAPPAATHDLAPDLAPDLAAANLAEEVFVCVMQASVEGASGALEDRAAGLRGGAARDRILRVCAEIGESASAAWFEAHVVRSGGEDGGHAACWLLRALVRVTADAATARAPLSAVVVRGVRAMPPLCLIPCRGSDGSLPAEASDLLVQLLAWTALRTASQASSRAPCPPSTLLAWTHVHAIALLSEGVLGLARLHRAQVRAGVPPARLDAPAVLHRAVCANAALPAALEQWRAEHGGGLGRSLPHLWPTVEELLAPRCSQSEDPAESDTLGVLDRSAVGGVDAMASDFESTDTVADSPDEAITDAAPDTPSPSQQATRMELQLSTLQGSRKRRLQ